MVNRHNILVEEFDMLTPLSVGNGNFNFTTDITVLQTFYNEYEDGITLGTMSNWGWHTVANTENYEMFETFKYHKENGRKISYQVQNINSERGQQATNYYRVNLHRLHLGIIRLVIKKENGEEIAMKEGRSGGLGGPRMSLVQIKNPPSRNVVREALHFAFNEFNIFRKFKVLSY